MNRTKRMLSKKIYDLIVVEQHSPRALWTAVGDLIWDIAIEIHGDGISDDDDFIEWKNKMAYKLCNWGKEEKNDE